MFMGLAWYWWFLLLVVVFISIPLKIKFLKWWESRSKGDNKKNKWGDTE